MHHPSVECTRRPGLVQPRFRWLTVLALLLVACGEAAGPPVRRPEAHLIISRGSDLWRYEVATQQWTQLTTVAPAGAAYEPAAAPDGRTIAYTYRPPLKHFNCW